MATPDVSSLAPFDDPKVKHKQKITARASFLAFNSVATRLLSDMARIYPTDATVRLLSKEMEKISADKSKMKIGGTIFFKEICKPTKNEDGSACQYIDLLTKHSPLAFNDPIPVAVLNGIGLGSKWQKMDAELQNAIWAYVDRLVHLSAQAVFCSSDATEEMNSLSRAVVCAAATGHGSTPQDLINNPGVQSAANKFVKTAVK